MVTDTCARGPPQLDNGMTLLDLVRGADQSPFLGGVQENLQLQVSGPRLA
jgi:hypothetical protein